MLLVQSIVYRCLHLTNDDRFLSLILCLGLMMVFIHYIDHRFD